MINDCDCLFSLLFCEWQIIILKNPVLPLQSKARQEANSLAKEHFAIFKKDFGHQGFVLLNTHNDYLMSVGSVAKQGFATEPAPGKCIHVLVNCHNV